MLDIVDIPVLKAAPNGFQQENWLIDPDEWWERKGTATVSDLANFEKSSGKLWLNGDQTRTGINDRIPTAEALSLRTSLELIYVDVLYVRVFTPGEAFGNQTRRVRGQFNWSGEDYAFWITDPVITKKYLDKPDGLNAIHRCHLSISLGVPYTDGFTYKLIAGVITQCRCPLCESIQAG